MGGGLISTSTGGTDTSNGKKIPFLFSVYGILGKDAQVILATFSQPMAAKMEEPIFYIKGWFNGLIAITVAGSYSRILHGARVTSPLQNQNTYWELGLGLAK